MKLSIQGNVVCTDKENNVWGIKTNTINNERKEILIVDEVFVGNRVSHSNSTVVVGLEVLLNKCGIQKEFCENETINLTIEME